MLSTSPTKLTKESSIARLLQFSVMIQVQERLPAQSNPPHEQSTLKLHISEFSKKVAKERIKVNYVNTENQAADIFTTSLAWPLFEQCKKRLGMISSKEMWPIISFSCLTCRAILRGELRNSVSRFQYKILSAHGCSEYFTFNNETSNFWKTNFIQFLNPASYSDLEEGVNEKQDHESKDGYHLHRRVSVYCTEQEFGTLYMRSS